LTRETLILLPASIAVVDGRRVLRMHVELLFSKMDFQFLVENPRCELMWNFPTTRRELFALIERANPKLVLVDRKIDLAKRGYRPLGPNPSKMLWMRP
jgi:hypothetical protein